MANSYKIEGKIVDVLNRKIFSGEIQIEGGKIASIIEKEVLTEQYILPGFIDAHIHIESSMLTPYEFARVALKHGTVATISDPHEIANVMGIEGVLYMIENAKGAKLKFHFGAPSCVPATSFESSGAILDTALVDELLHRPDIYYLSEMMNYPGVLFDDKEVLKKIALAKKYNKPVDGHAPGLRGEQAKKYIDAGISTDHECFTLEEALEKISLGMKILIREGSAARNFAALHTLINLHPNQCMFCCDDKHPDELLLFHIDEHVRKSISLGYDLMDVLNIACINPIKHYKMDVGKLQIGDKADFITVNNLTDFCVTNTFIDGEAVVCNGRCSLTERSNTIVNNFQTGYKTKEQFKVDVLSHTIKVIEALDGQLITNSIIENIDIIKGNFESDLSKDILKIAVINRYDESEPAIAFIKNFGLKRGAIASTVAHDSHNIIVVGVDDESICRAVNLVIEEKGGLSLIDGDFESVIPLPIAGLMSDQSCEVIGEAYLKIDKQAKAMGSQLKAPYMLLSFMALLVIPELKLSDKGLFDGKEFKFTNNFVI
jgi:adenine deaminase